MEPLVWYEKKRERLGDRYENAQATPLDGKIFIEGREVPSVLPVQATCKPSSWANPVESP